MVQIWLYYGGGRCEVYGCQGKAAWWLEGTDVAICDACVLALLRQLVAEELVAEERVCLTIAKV